MKTIRTLIIASFTLCANPIWASVDINDDYFPDEIFRNYVSAHFDSDGDGVLSESELEAVTEIDIEYLVRDSETPQFVRTTAGIEYFTNLESLNVSQHLMSKIDVSNNLNLRYLYMRLNQVTDLNLSNNTKLEVVDCSFNTLESLYLNLPKLTALNCEHNVIGNLNVKGCENLTDLNCSYTYITSLDISSNKKLRYLNARQCRSLSDVDLTECEELNEFDLSYTGLKSLNLSYNTKLERLDCSAINALNKLDLRFNPLIQYVECQNGQLETINLSNCPYIHYLNIASNLVSELDLSNNTSLDTLIVSSNRLSSVDLSNHSKLKYVDISGGGNSIESIDISAAKDLNYLSIDRNPISEINLTNNKALKHFSAVYCQLKSLDVSNCSDVEYIDVQSNKEIEKMDLLNAIELKELYCQDNSISNLDVSNNTKLVYLYCGKNKLRTINVRNNPQLARLGIENNNLICVDLSQNPKLESFSAQNQTRIIPVDKEYNAYIEELDDDFNLDNSYYWRDQSYNDVQPQADENGIYKLNFGDSEKVTFNYRTECPVSKFNSMTKITLIKGDELFRYGVHVDYDSTMGSVNINNQNISDVCLWENSTVEIQVLPNSDAVVEKITLNGNDVTDELFDDILKIESIHEDVTIDVHFVTNQAAVSLPVLDTNSRSEGIYSIDGRYMGKDNYSLKKGIYIINGKKSYIRK